MSYFVVFLTGACCGAAGLHWRREISRWIERQIDRMAGK